MEFIVTVFQSVWQYGNERMKLYAKDVICTAIIYWGFRFLFTKKPKRTTFYALIFHFLIEFSQLYHQPWIDQIRDTRSSWFNLRIRQIYADKHYSFN